ncbi:hypothetical protein [Aeromicrobium sp. 179-A 4D2 NHS]|uniref:hypothetical protein n=1 Tax=Aeromicrobium sp. 179-A 4D2 NHS TaxID=3142375 RepID=UPI0039A2AAB4
MSPGLGIALGTVAGTVLFAVTGEVLWVALGPSLGLLVATLFGVDDEEAGDGQD